MYALSSRPVTGVESSSWLPKVSAHGMPRSSIGRTTLLIACFASRALVGEPLMTSPLMRAKSGCTSSSTASCRATVRRSVRGPSWVSLNWTTVKVPSSRKRSRLRTMPSFPAGAEGAAVAAPAVASPAIAAAVEVRSRPRREGLREGVMGCLVSGRDGHPYRTPTA